MTPEQAMGELGARLQEIKNTPASANEVHKAVQAVASDMSVRASRSRLRLHTRVVPSATGARVEFSGEGAKDAAKYARRALHAQAPTIARAVTTDVAKRLT